MAISGLCLIITMYRLKIDHMGNHLCSRAHNEKKKSNHGFETFSFISGIIN